MLSVAPARAGTPRPARRTRGPPATGTSLGPVFPRRRPSLLSVVVPAYDVAAYLPACLDSVLAQSETLGRTGLEVVVVDDGSPDESGELAESYAARDPRVRVVHTDN